MLECPDADRARTEAELKACEQELLLYGNSGVLRAYTAIRELRKMPQPQAECWAVEKVVRAMRMECKQQTVGLERRPTRAVIVWSRYYGYGAGWCKSRGNTEVGGQCARHRARWSNV